MNDWIFQAKLLRWFHSSKKKSFVFSEAAYNHWVLLAADDGSFQYRVAEEEGVAKFGEIVLCPPGTKLYRRAQNPLSFLFIEFDWTNSEKELKESSLMVSPGKVSFRRIDRYSSTFSCIRELSNLNPRDHLSYKQHLLMDILYLYALEQRDKRVHSPVKDPVIQDAVQYIQNHAYEPISLKKLANQAYLSQSQFSRRFHTSMKISPNRYLTAIRMQKAQTLLLDTDLTLEIIAQQCGYQNGFYLSRVFKNTYNMSPSMFRKTHRV